MLRNRTFRILRLAIGGGEKILAAMLDYGGDPV
jgi:hypothetical protein